MQVTVEVFIRTSCIVECIEVLPYKLSSYFRPQLQCPLMTCHSVPNGELDCIIIHHANMT